MAHVRVLIADDSPSFRREIRTLLELEPGIEVVGEATDGWESIEKTETLQPDVVLMDNNMPSLGGVDATLRIRARHPDVRILFLVAEDIWREEALAAGAEGYFLKSADLDRLFHEIRKTPRLAYEERARIRIEATRTRWRAAFGDRAMLLGPAGRALAFCFSVWIVGAAVVQMARRLGLATPQTDGWLIFSAVALGPLLGVASFLFSLRDAVSVGRKRLEQRESRLPAPLRRLQEHPNYHRLAKIAWLVVLLAALGGLLLSPGLRSFLARVSTGQVVAGISLTFGLLFFVYATRYYAIIALILFYNGGNGVNGNGHNGNGINGTGRNGNGLRRKGLNGNGFNGNGIFNHRGSGPGARLRRLIGGLVRALLRRGANGTSNGMRNGLGNHNGVANHGSEENGFHLDLEEQPFVSVHLPIFNEESVVDRLLETCSQLDYEKYEVIVADDSGDNTVRRLERWAKHPKVKISHRINRSGFKGAALKHAMEIMDPQTEFVVIFDADFIPPPQIIWQFLSYFFGAGGNGNGNGNGQGNGNGNGRPYQDRHSRYVDDKIAVVQGYQWHMLNADENWLTKGVRAEYSGSYVMERSGQELLGTMKMISGSVYMIRADVLRSLGWGTSITEDWELTLKLYLYGYKVLYTPFIQAPSECVSTFGRLVRQRMRWAEGHTFNVKKYFPLVMASPKLSLGEKLEFLYYAPYYLQSLFFTVGTTAWFLSEVILREGIPYWTSLLGWSLVLTNMGALILMNLAGIFMERGVKKEWSGVLSAVIVGMLLVPFQAYGALKALLESHEGGWVRTPKTGAITEVIDKLDLGGKLRWLLPRRRRRAPRASASKISRMPGLSWLLRRPARLANTLIGGMATMIAVLSLFSPMVPVVLAAPDSFYLHVTTTNGATINPGEDMTTTIGTGPTATKTFNAVGSTYWYNPDLWPTGDDDASIAAGDYTLHMHFSGCLPVIVACDTFTDTDGTFLENHTPDQGTSWQVVRNEEWVVGGQESNTVNEKSGTSNFAKETTDIGSDQMDITVDVKNLKNDDPTSYGGPMGRLPSGNIGPGSSNQDGFAAVLEGNSDTTGADLVMYRITNGSRVEIGRYDANITDTNFHTIKLELRTNQQQAYLDGTLRITTTDTAHAGNNFAGLHARQDVNRFDNFKSVRAGANVQITVYVHHTASDGSGETLITNSAQTTIDENTANPLDLGLGSGTSQTFTSDNRRLLRLQINVDAITGGAQFILDYDNAEPDDSNLQTPIVVVPENVWLLLPLGVVLPGLILGMQRRRRAREVRIHE